MAESVLQAATVKVAQLAQIGFIVVAALIVYAFVATAKDGESRRACTPLCTMRPSYAARNRLAPGFELPNLKGQKVSLSDYSGKVVILNFWTKTCRPCLEELPSLADLAKVLREQDNMEIVTICTDESAKDARETLQSVLGGDPPFEVLMDPDSKVVADKFGTQLYPETWFIDPKGVIRARIDGQRDWATALTVDLARSLTLPVACDVSFHEGSVSGRHAEICDDVNPS
jgi:thiol-disulfide isomerase/thioredoxin